MSRDLEELPVTYESRSAHVPARIEFTFSYGDYMVSLELGEKLEGDELNQALVTWVMMCKELIVR